MRPDQRLTPKYWVFHDKYADDIYLDTAAKGYDQCKDKANALYPEKLRAFHENDARYEVALIEIRLVGDAEPITENLWLS